MGLISVVVLWGTGRCSCGGGVGLVCVVVVG